MHKSLKLHVILITLLIVSFSIVFPVFATDTESSNITETMFFGNYRDDGSACGVFSIVNIIVDILSIGIGVLALIGITTVGVRILTSAGNEEQTRKAKRRMFQIIIGLVLYALLYAGAQWLLPGGKLDFSNRCELVSDEELAQIKAREKAEREEERRRNEIEAIEIIRERNKYTPGSGGGGGGTYYQQWLDAIDSAAIYMKNTHYGSRYNNDPCGNNYWSNYKCAQFTGTCATYVSIALQEFKAIPKNTYIYTSYGKLSGSASAVKAIKKNKNIQVLYPKKTAKQLKQQENIKIGDIVMYYKYHSSENGDIGHIMIFMGFNSKGDPLFNELGGGGLKTKTTRNDYSWREIAMIVRVKE